MKRFLPLFALLLAVLLTTRAAQAQVPAGFAAAFPFGPSKVLADPTRTRVYATVTANNQFNVIDTTTLQKIASLAVGSVPVDMAISRDGTRLYVANAGSTLEAVTVIDLDTLAVLTNFPLPGPAVAIAAGLNDRVYVTVETAAASSIYQIDGTTGAIQGTFSPGTSGNAPLQLTPDATQLFVDQSSGLISFDVSTARPGLIQKSTVGMGATQIVLSRDGKYLCAPRAGGDGNGVPLTTLLLSAQDIDTYYGTFSDPARPGPLVFSQDETHVYQTRYDGKQFTLDVFNTVTFNEINNFGLPADGLTLTAASPVTVDIDNTGTYLFIGQRVSTATDSAGQLLVASTDTLLPPVVTSGLTASAMQYSPFTYQIAASNFPYTFNATGLPAGLTVDTATGLISGTPTAYGVFPVIISATNLGGTATATLRLTVSMYPLPVITSSLTASGMQYSPFTYRITASNSSFAFNATGLPAGLSVNTTTGLISGTPTTFGVFPVIISATNLGGTTPATLQLTISKFPLPVITSSLTASGTQGTPFTYQITASNSPFAFNASGLPTGLSVNTTTGLISGTPIAFGVFQVIISATNLSGTTPATLQLTIANGGPSILPVILNTSLPDGVLNQPYTATLTATNSPISFSAIGVPPGLNLDPTTGVLSGSPTVAGLYGITLSATNVYGTGPSSVLFFNIATSAFPPPVITSAGTASAMLDMPFAYQITATGIPSSFAAGSLPKGLSVDSATGLISGSPTIAGIYSLALSATNAGGTGSALLTLTVTAPPVPVITSASTGTATTGTPFNFQITATNNPTTFAASGLPSGLSIDPATGITSGSPTVPGTFSLVFNATNASGTGTATFTLIVSAALPVITSNATATAPLGQPFSYQIMATNNPAGFTAANLPPGLGVDSVVGLISGTPTAAGVFTIPLTATNVGGTASATLTLTVVAVLPTIDIVATGPSVVAGSGDHGSITISRTGDLSQKLVVHYTIKGSAVNGVDYETLNGTAKIKPYKISTTIQIIPEGTLPAGEVKTVKLRLTPSDTYFTGDRTKAKVRIISGS